MAAVVYTHSRIIKYFKKKLHLQAERTNRTVKLRLRKTGRTWLDCIELVKIYMRIPPTENGLTL